MADDAPAVAFRYTGQAFRARHEVGLRELARGAGVRPARLVDLEKARTAADLTDLARIATYFRRCGIACGLADLVEEVPDEEEAPV
jgi:hypothetical protein